MCRLNDNQRPNIYKYIDFYFKLKQYSMKQIESGFMWTFNEYTSGQNFEAKPSDVILQIRKNRMDEILKQIVGERNE